MFVFHFETDLSIMHAQSVLAPLLICVRRERGCAVKSNENAESEPKWEERQEFKSSVMYVCTLLQYCVHIRTNQLVLCSNK